MRRATNIALEQDTVTPVDIDDNGLPRDETSFCETIMGIV